MTSTEATQTAAGFAERDLTVRGTRVRVLETGSGQPLLYLHDSGDLGERTRDQIGHRHLLSARYSSGIGRPHWSS